ncbi:hypothetical protein N8H74_02220 [Pseudomonas sp. B2M1-30]|uniref:hypothetical protein n=1 Tax=Pseudomonas TaxID=286 RepID=UPI0021C9B574|nr:MULTISPECIES: hypothetical protein [Pseudomonas]MCU0117052.1 hypothetical protein [Pseudomonas sp. B2M1-30]MCU7260446.1 hypothetical protein [Pseudomonas koreensis]
MSFSDIVAISGLLLTLTTFMFNLAWPKLNEALELDGAQPGELARKRSRKKVLSTFFSCALPLAIAFVALFYVNLPPLVKIMRSSTLDLWDFDVGNTLFVMVAYALLVFAALNIWICVRLLTKWRELH